MARHLDSTLQQLHRCTVRCLLHRGTLLGVRQRPFHDLHLLRPLLQRVCAEHTGGFQLLHCEATIDAFLVERHRSLEVPNRIQSRAPLPLLLQLLGLLQDSRPAVCLP